MPGWRLTLGDLLRIEHVLEVRDGAVQRTGKGLDLVVDRGEEFQFGRDFVGAGREGLEGCWGHVSEVTTIDEFHDFVEQHRAFFDLLVKDLAVNVVDEVQHVFAVLKDMLPVAVTLGDFADAGLGFGRTFLEALAQSSVHLFTLSGQFFVDLGGRQGRQTLVGVGDELAEE